MAIQTSQIPHTTNWRDYCPSFRILIPEFKFLQCEDVPVKYDFDFSDVIPIPPSSPLFQSSSTTVNSTQYMLLQTNPTNKTNQNTTFPKSIFIHKENGMWMHSIISNKHPREPPESNAFLQITTSTSSGYHHKLEISANANNTYCIVLFLPKDVILDKDELQLLQRKHPAFPQYITTTRLSSVESPVDFGTPQLLFLFGNSSFPIVFSVPIHMRYAFPHNVNTENHRHLISIPPAMLLVYSNVSILSSHFHKQSRILINGRIIANRMELLFSQYLLGTRAIIRLSIG